MNTKIQVRVFSWLGRGLMLGLAGALVAACSGGGGDGGGGIAAPTGLSYPDPGSVNTTAAVNLMPTVTGTVTTFSVTPALPGGLTLNATTGAITGMPTATTGQTTYTITAANAGGSTTFALLLTVHLGPPVALSYPTPQTLTTTSVVNLMPSVTGTVTTYTVTPALPAGVALNGTTGAITGTPTSPSAETTYTVTAANASGSTAFSLQLMVTRAALAIVTGAAPPNGTIGVTYNKGNGQACFVFHGLCEPCFPYASTRICPAGWRYQNSFVFRASGGVAPYTWSATSLPPGIRFIAVGALGGTPLATGTYNVVVTVTDSATPADHASATFTIIIAPPPPPTVNTVPEPSVGAINKPYRNAFAVAGGGQSPFTWSETGALPPGLVFGADGTLAGTPTKLGSFPITVTVKDAANQSSLPQDFTILIVAHGFRVTGSLSQPLSAQSATRLKDGTALVAGGRDENSNSLAIAERFDPAQGKFASTGAMVTARQRHTATLLNDGKVLMTGGIDSNQAVSATAELFNATTGAFAAVHNMATARYAHTATLLGDGTVLIAGGIDLTGTSMQTAELFNPTSGAFTAVGHMAAARANHTATLLSDGTVLIAGGEAGGQAMAAAELFNPVTRTFVATASMSSPRTAHTASLLPDGSVLLVGGISDSGAVATAEVYEPALAAFTPTGSMATLRSGHTATLLPDGTVLVAGGLDGTSYLVSASAELFDPASGEFTVTGSMVTPRVGHTATLLNDGTVLVVGGFSSVGEVYR